MKKLILALLLLVPIAAPADQNKGSSTALEAPELLVFSHMGAAATFGADPSPNGWESNFTENGFTFQKVRAELNQGLGKHLDLKVDLEFTMRGVAIDSFQTDFKNLPGALTVTAGYWGTDLGLENSRSPAVMTFVDSPLALQRIFGARNHRSLGVAILAEPPTPWDLKLYASAISADDSESMRSWYGDAGVPVESITDLAAHFYVKNRGNSGNLALYLGLDAIIGPNDSGRDNATNVFGVSLGLTLNPENVDSGFRLEFESEWLLRRRQIPGGVLQDLGGWAWVALHFLPQWTVAVRYEATQGLKNDPLDPLDDAWRHRSTLSLACRVVPRARLRLSSHMDTGGPLDDPNYTTVLHFEVGAAFSGSEEN
jgi:hypothetical protein